MGKFITTLVNYIRPVPIVIAMITFSLGTGIADFLGHQINWASHWIGMICILLLLSGSYLLNAYFTFNMHNPAIEEEPSIDPEQIPAANFKRAVLQISLMLLASFVALFVLLLANGSLNLAVIIFLGIAFFLMLLYSVPPFQLAKTGYAELIESIFLVNLVPAAAFLLQIDVPHRLLIMLTMPLTGLTIAMMLANALPTYGNDIKIARENLMTSIGWEKGMQLHNLLIVLSYAIVIMAFVFGMPWRLVWPGMLTLPIGFYQIWQIRQIAIGIKPNWKMLRLTSITLVGLTAYLITISLWIG